MSDARFAALADYHTHTPLCRHAEGWPVDLARVAVERGLGELGFADHNPMPKPFDDWRMLIDELPQYLDAVAQARAEFPQLAIKLGLECDFLVGQEAWIEELAGMAEWDYLIGSVHYLPEGWEVDNPKYLSRHTQSSAPELWDAYWKTYGACIRSGLFDFVAHPDLPKKFGVRPEGDLRRYYEPAIEALAAAGIAYEINTAGLRKDCAEVYPATEFVTLAHSAGVPLLINSDAHRPEEVAAGFGRAMELAKEAGYTQTAVFHGANGRSLRCHEARGPGRDAGVFAASRDGDRESRCRFVFRRRVDGHRRGAGQGAGNGGGRRGHHRHRGGKRAHESGRHYGGGGSGATPAIHRRMGRATPLSINTWRAGVVRKVLPRGGHLLNDIGGLPTDENARICAKTGAALLIMHTVGEPKVPHNHVTHGEIMETLMSYFREKIAVAEAAGVRPEAIVLDPGIDFAKQRADNLRILRELPRLAEFGKPILLPVSRKTVIGDVLGIPPAERDAGTVACIVSGMLRGAHIFRVHNARAAAQAIRIVAAAESAR